MDLTGKARKPATDDGYLFIFFAKDGMGIYRYTPTSNDRGMSGHAERSVVSPTPKLES